MKKFLTVLLAIACAFALVACGTNNGGSGSESGTDAYPTELSDKAFGHAVKYDPELPVNNGEEITLDYWLWTSDAIWQSVVDAYTAIHPNVHINIIRSFQPTSSSNCNISFAFNFDVMTGNRLS
jgi:multiple sugar transport system substrate-binding protein